MVGPKFTGRTEQSVPTPFIGVEATSRLVGVGGPFGVTAFARRTRQTLIGAAVVEAFHASGVAGWSLSGTSGTVRDVPPEDVSTAYWKTRAEVAKPGLTRQPGKLVVFTDRRGSNPLLGAYPFLLRARPLPCP